MSVLQSPVVGRMKQKMGGVVFTSWKGINVMKGRPLTVANPKTDKQLMRRSALLQIVNIARILVAQISLGFREQAVKKSSFNAFVGYNLRNAFNYDSPPAAQLVVAQLKTGQGTISQTPFNVESATSSNKHINVSFAPGASSPGQSASDLPIAVLYNANDEKFWPLTTLAGSRATGSATFVAPPDSFNEVNSLRIILFFYNESNRKSSDSLQMEIISE
jgi:hypothetical protein